MIDQENDGQSSGDDTREDDALIGRPDWSARESAAHVNEMHNSLQRHTGVGQADNPNRSK